VQVIRNAIQSPQIGLMPIEELPQAHPGEARAHVDDGAVREAGQLQFEPRPRQQRPEQAAPALRRRRRRRARFQEPLLQPQQAIAGSHVTLLARKDQNRAQRSCKSNAF